MSASHKKQLRKEQNAAQMTEKQLAANKEAKQLKRYTRAFFAVIAVMVAIAIATTVLSSGIIERNTTAVTVDTSKISAVELNYYYIDAINSYMNQWGDYISLSGIDTKKPLDEQVMDEESGDTWADYFLDMATENIHAIYAVYNKATANGYTLTEEDTAAINSSIDTMKLYATFYYGYTDVESYLRAVYGAGANLDSYKDYAGVQMVASRYATDISEELSYTAEDISAVLTEHPKDYTTYSYNYYHLPVTSFLEGGTKNEEGTVIYSDEEKDAATAACKAAADSFLDQGINSPALLDKAVKSLAINEGKENVASTAITNRGYTNLSGVLKDWVSDDARVPGDLGVIANETTTTGEDGKEVTSVTGYYVVVFNGSDDQTFTMNNVRHILVAFEGGTKDDKGNVTYSDEEKAKAKAEAEEILAAYLAGEKTEEAFAALTKAHTDDVDSAGNPNNDGLYENIIPTSNFVENFRNWAIADERVAGETGIVETEYGYHVMYFVGDSEQTYRDYLITNTLRSEDMTAWEDALVEASTMTVANTEKVNTALTLSSGE